MKRFLTVAVAMLALTGMGQVAMRKLEDITNTNLVCVTDYGPQIASLTHRVTGLEGSSNDWSKTVSNLAALSNNVANLSSRATETNELFSAWLSGLQSRTSYWDTAYSWGDHALAGYLLPADLSPYATTAALAVHTNRNDNPHGVTAPQIGALTAEQDLAALRAYHYGSPDIVESPAGWFVFDGAGTVTAFNWSAGRTNVVIPWAIGGVPVTAIGPGAFQTSGIVSVIAPQTVTSIGDGAFYERSSLTSVTIPQVTSIGDSAFYYCSSLTSVTIPQVTSIGNNAFTYCFLLTSVTIPQATSIGGYAFYQCFALTSVRMGQNAPAEATYVFADITPTPTVYVTDPQATGWGDTWNGAPVVRPPLYADAIYQAGELVATTGHVAQAIAAIPEPDLSSRVAVQSGHASNLAVSGWLALPQSQPTNLIMRLVTSNDVIMAIGVIQ